MEAHSGNLLPQNHKARRYRGRILTQTHLSPKSDLRSLFSTLQWSWCLHWFQQGTQHPVFSQIILLFEKSLLILISLHYLVPCKALFWVFPVYHNILVLTRELNSRIILHYPAVSEHLIDISQFFKNYYLKEPFHLSEKDDYRSIVFCPASGTNGFWNDTSLLLGVRGSRSLYSVYHNVWKNWHWKMRSWILSSSLSKD